MGSASAPVVGSRIGQVAPDFSLKARDGRTVSLAESRGKVVLLNFWATWCAPCREEMPSMQRLSELMKQEPFEILAVSVDEGGWREIDPFVKSLGLPFTVLWDEKGDVAASYKTYRFPETYLLDPKGRILDKRVGGLAWDQPNVIAFIRSALPQPPTPVSPIQKPK